MRLGFSPMTARMLDVEEAFRLASELHLDFVELSFDLHEVLPALQAVDRIARLSRATGVGTTLHLSYVDLNLASLMPVARAAAVERTLAGIAYAERVGASCAVLHTGQHHLRHPQADALAATALDASFQALAGAPVPIALENLALGDADYLRTPAELRALADRYALSTCLDFGHAHVQGVREGTDAASAYLEALGPTLAHLHVHGNHGTADEHLASDQGTLDYAAHAAFLRDFPGTVCLEIATGADGVRASVAHLRRLVEAAA
ncbi:MAG: sugar phosphate isomerase/epimerase family protein [Trueperaceae bacterium]